MARRSVEEMKLVQDYWYKLMGDPEFRTLSRVDKAKRLDVDEKTLLSWERLASQDDWAIWEASCETIIAQRSPEIYKAITDKAIKGDVKAQELWMQKFKNWSSKQISEVTTINKEDMRKSDEELIKQVKEDLKKEMTKEDIETLLKSLQQ